MLSSAWNTDKLSDWSSNVEVPSMLHQMIAAGVLIAGVVSGATGLAFPLIAGPILLLVYPPVQAVFLTAACSLVGQLFSMTLLQQSVRFEMRWQLIVPGLFCVPFGTQLLLLANSHILRLGFGVMLAIFSLCFLIHNRVVTPRGKLGDIIVGMFGGICGGLFGVSSAVPALWFCMQELDRHRQRGIVQPYIVAMQFASLIALLTHGVERNISLANMAWLPLCVLAGVALGVLIFKKITCEIYSRLVAFVALASGIALVVRW